MTGMRRGELVEVVQLLALLARRLHGRGRIPEALRDAFRRGSLGPRHMPVLFSVARAGPATVGELAARLDLARPTVSLLVNELSRAGLAERTEDEHDRRRTIVSVPEQERRLLVRLSDERLDLARRTLTRLEPEARRHFVEGLRILAEELGARSRR